MTTATTKMITIHPFNDEWLWDDTGEEAWRIATLDEAHRAAIDYRKENLHRNREDRNQVDFIRGMWFALHEGDDAGELVGLVAPDDRLLVDGEARAMLARIDSSGDWPDHPEGCDCDGCARRMVADTFAGPKSGAEPRCPNCGAGMDELELDDEDQRAFCNRCATEGPAEDCIHAGVEAATERWMVCLDGGSDRDGDDDLDRWDALTRARTIRIEHPDAVVSMVLLPEAEREGGRPSRSQLGGRDRRFRDEARRAIAALARLPVSEDVHEARDAVRQMARAAGIEY